MAQAYFIGGAPRVGKSTVLLQFLKANPMYSLSTDGLRKVLRGVISEADMPNLFHADEFLGEDPKVVQQFYMDPGSVITLQNNESIIVWKSVLEYVESSLSSGLDIVVEGIAILPEFLAELDIPYKVVLLGNESKDHAQEIRAVARQNEYDWMHELADETISLFGAFCQAHSQHIKEEAAHYDLPYVEMNDESFDESVSQAIALLKA